MQNEKILVRIGDREYDIIVNSDIESGIIYINGEESSYKLENLSASAASLLLNGKSNLFTIIPNEDGYTVGWSGGEVQVEIEDERARLMKKLLGGAATKRARKRVRAPMPGLVVKLLAEVGAEVKKGDPLIVVEAMKMENEITSPASGKISEINVTEEQVVEKDEVLITLEG